MNTLELLNDLTSYLAERNLRVENGSNHSLGNSGIVNVYPKTEEGISLVLKYATDHKLTISIMGRGTKRGFGGLNETSDILLSLEDYKGVVEHTVGDMTLTVKAGTTFQEIQDYLDDTNQRIALDPFNPFEATIGGILGANDSGPKRFKYGSSRDSVIGLRILYPDGSVIRTGGKVVKNVAGYDMNKLFIGSMGTLGVISEVTFKLRPLAKYESLVLLSFPEGNMDNIKLCAKKVLDSVLEPVCMELLSPSLSDRLFHRNDYILAVSFEDVESSVHYQIKLLKDIMPANTVCNILSKEDAQVFWEKFYQITPASTSSGNNAETIAALKIGVVNFDVLKVIKKADLLQDVNNIKIEAHGGLGHGLCQLIITGAKEDILSAIEKIRKIVLGLEGYVIVKHLPFTIRKDINVWGEKPPHFFLLEGIKSKIDPNRILNPSRFVGGI
ncbi:FAD-binding oxidoreductase [Bacillus sp. FJAT-49705]|uniref:FAD-binding oxidoreductase n=1 Tax=Cytobacillus citreus TaxID=2833586 RepID=A0ABS5P050_9BACI|nr:FAD-binding oxidoreductase [Cytobacillus citreus]MBS4192998.1 FAD-binding oxidoreductase [Cytobacillus citreus]